MPFRRSLLGLTLAILVMGGLAPTPAPAQDQQYALSNYDVDLALRTDGTYRVTETLTFDFQQGSFSSAHRTLPLDAIGAVRAVEVTSTEASVRSVTHGEEDGDYVIEWQYPERSAPATFTLRYVVEDALFVDDGDNVVDWAAVGGGWGVPVRDVDVAVSIPFDVARDSLSIAPEGEGTLSQTGSGWTAQFRHEALAANTSYRVVVRFPQRLAGQPAAPSGGWMVMIASLAGLLGIGGGVGALVAWRGPSASDASPAPGVTDRPLPEAGYLLADTAGERRRAVSAVLFDLARRGHVTLRREEEDQFIGSREVVRVEVHVDRPASLSDFETALLEAVQEYDSLRAFGKQSGSFRREHMADVREGLLAEGLLRSHRQRSNACWAAAAALLIGGISLPFALSGTAAAVALGTGLGGGIGAAMAASRRYLLTERGARAKAALQDHLERLRGEVEQARDTNPPAAVERLLEHLPWLALDTEVDASWLEDLESALEEVDSDVALPGWLVDTVGAEDPESVAHAAFIPILHVVSTTQATAGGAAAAAGASAGAAGAAAAGGGGGGAA